jgi:hypothetical protein
VRKLLISKGNDGKKAGKSPQLAELKELSWAGPRMREVIPEANMRDVNT